MNLERHKAQMLLQARMPKHLQGKTPQEPTVKPNSYTSFNRNLAKAQEAASANAAIEGDVKKIQESATTVTETVSSKEVRAFLERASSVVSERSDQIHNTDERDSFLLLSNLIKDHTPLPEATDEDVMRSLASLKQQIVVDEKDSDHLSAVKNHLRAEIDKML
jgi:hypothetical protein